MNKTLPIVHIELKKKRRVDHVWLYPSHVKMYTQDGSGERHVDQGLFDLKIIQGYMQLP